MDRIESNYQKYRQLLKCLIGDNNLSQILREPLSGIFSNEVQSRIRHSSNLFFEEFERSDDERKYKYLIIATRDINQWIPKFLEKTKDAKMYRRKIELIFELLHLQPEKIVQSFPMSGAFLCECQRYDILDIVKTDYLVAVLNDKGPITATYYLILDIASRPEACYGKLLCLLHQHKSNYIEQFCESLHKKIIGCDERYAEGYIMCYADCLVLRNINVNDITEEGDMEETESDNGQAVQASVCSDSNDIPVADVPLNTDDCSDENMAEECASIFHEIQDKQTGQFLDFQPEIDPSNVAEESLEMRQYQMELATKGIEGKNVLICAPTSSGKTMVAIKIAQDHMLKNKSNKVAMVVTTTVLVDQQYNQFQRFLGKRFKIIKLSGGSKSLNVSLSKQVNDYDIFVFTSDILRNALKETEDGLESISEFSLIIFDECHHTDKEHSYNKVMDHYFKDKELDKKVPQIIGMTASTGTDKAKNIEEALNSLISLCANLDCYTVSTVTKNIEELEKVLPSPLYELKPVCRRNIDKFESNLITLMETTERTLQSILRPKNQPIDIPTERYQDKYLSFVKGIRNHCQSLLTEEEHKAVNIIEIYLENLYRALIINHLFTYWHAKDMLENEIDTKAPCTCDVEMELRRVFMGFLSSDDLQQDNNPSLEYLKDEIKRQMKSDRKSKIIVFVKEVLYARILEKEIKQAKLGFVSCQVLVGTNKSSDQGGLSNSKRDEIVSRFRKGIDNVLFVTSIAEEGLDFDACNLVIMYGHVTNEIAMVQSRGRARAPDSKYLLIVPHELRSLIDKENVNKIRETMMYKAIEEFQRMDLNLRKEKIFEFHKCRKALRTVEPSSNVIQLPAKTVDKNEWALICIKCDAYICSSDDIRSSNGNSFIDINKCTYGNLKIITGKSSNLPIVCSKCDQNLGFIVKVKDINVPTIKITQVQIKKRQ